MIRPRPIPHDLALPVRVRLAFVLFVVCFVLGSVYVLSYIAAQNARHSQAVRDRNAQSAAIAKNHRDVAQLACSLVGVVPPHATLPAANRAHLQAISRKYNCVVNSDGVVVPSTASPSAPGARPSSTPGALAPAASATPRSSGPRTSAARSAARTTPVAARTTRPRSTAAHTRPASAPATPAPPAPSASTCVGLLIASVCVPRL